MSHKAISGRVGVDDLFRIAFGAFQTFPLPIQIYSMQTKLT